MADEQLQRLRRDAAGDSERVPALAAALIRAGRRTEAVEALYMAGRRDIALAASFGPDVEGALRAIAIEPTEELVALVCAQVGECIDAPPGVGRNLTPALWCAVDAPRRPNGDRPRCNVYLTHRVAGDDASRRRVLMVPAELVELHERSRR